MWDQLSIPWQACFQEAWGAYCAGSIPIGAVLADQHDHILYRGRNRINEDKHDHEACLANSRIAHAEINVLLQVPTKEASLNKDRILYTTTEPCLLCFGACEMSYILHIRYAAADPYAGGTNAVQVNEHVASKPFDIVGPFPALGDVQRVLRTDYVLRILAPDRAAFMLEKEGADYPAAVSLGKRWYAEGRLQLAMKHREPISILFNEILDLLDIHLIG